jgi:NADH-quinone oxidoreductase subunit K
VTSVWLALLVFCVGLYGVLTRRDIVAVLAAAEVMLGGATLLFVVLASSYAPASGTAPATVGQATALLLLAVVAAEAAVGLALLVALVRRGKTRMDDIREVRG